MPDDRILIIGAGIGGLTAGALLARQGYKVLICEQSDQVGGCCQSFTRNGHRFDAFASQFMGLGPEGYNSLRHVYEELGISIKTHSLDPCYVFSVGGKKIKISPDPVRTFHNLDLCFPGTGGQYNKLLKHLKFYRGAVDRLPFHRPTTLGGALIWFLKYGWCLSILAVGDRRGMDKLMDRHVSNENLRGIIDSQLKVFNPDASKDCPAILGSLVLTEPHRGGIFYPTGGASILSGALSNAITAHGGQVRLGTKVEKISVRNGKVSGVVLSDNEIIPSSIVISNASAWSTYGKMVDSSYLPKKLLRTVASLKPTGSIFICYLSIDKKFAEENLDSHLYWPQMNNSIPTMMLSVPSLTDPTAAPENKHAGMLYCPANYYEWDRISNYEVKKKQEKENILRNLDQRFPSFMDNAEVLASATPRTVERFTLRDFGSIGGPRSSIDQWHARLLPHSTPVKGLFHVGDSTFPGSGIVAAVTSGIMCADNILG